MKEFAKEHPFLTFFIVLSVLGTIRFLFYTMKNTKETVNSALEGKYYVNPVTGLTEYNRDVNGNLLPL